MVRINYDPKILNEGEALNKIKKELKEDRLLNALLLAHGYIEAYLLEIIIYSSEIDIKQFNKKVIESIERINFHNLLHISLIFNNISFDLYNRIVEFNKERNKIVHELISININNEKVRKRIKKNIKNALEICEQLLGIYKRKIKEKKKQLKVG